jgi:hypothetical protein
VPPRLPVAASAAPARPPRRGETAPDHLLQAPPGVAPVADDFFDALIRRVEGDR